MRIEYNDSPLVNYKGKFGFLQPNIVNGIYSGYQLWVLEDVEQEQWSSYIYLFAPPRKNIVAKTKSLSKKKDEENPLSFVGTSDTGEIVLSPMNISDSFYLQS